MAEENKLNGEVIFETPVQAWEYPNHAPMNFKTEAFTLSDGDKTIMKGTVWVTGTLEIWVYQPDGKTIAATYLVPMSAVVNRICERHGLDYQQGDGLFATQQKVE